jgi:hypothetical protein
MKKFIALSTITLAIVALITLTVAGTKRTALMLDSATGVTTQTADFTSGNLKIGGTALGTAAVLNAGTAANNVVQLDSSAKLPAVDGSLLTNLPLSSGGKLIVEGSGYGLDNGSITRGTVGTKSVSLEYGDIGSDRGASGGYSFTCGRNSTASGYASVACGNGTTASGYGASAFCYGTTASGDYSFACGNGTTANGDYSFAGGNQTTTNDAYSFAYGYGATASGGSIALGTNLTANGAQSFACGKQTIASGAYSFACGKDSKTLHIGEFSHSSGFFNTQGDCQNGKIQVRIATGSTSLTELFLDGSSTRFTLSDGDAYSCRVTVLGKQADGSCGTAVHQVLIKNEGGTTSLTGTLQTIVTWLGDTNIGTPTWTISADDTNDALSIKITPANTTATRWTALIEYVKINY